MTGFICPSNPNPCWLNPAAKEDFVINCKAMGATHIESLNCCLGPARPLYGEPKSHPDAAIFPGEGLRLDDFRDGTSHTILVAETMDATASLWTRPKDTELVGLPTSGKGAVRFAKSPAYEFVAPEGYNGKFGSEASATVRSMRTFLELRFCRRRLRNLSVV